MDRVRSLGHELREKTKQPTATPSADDFAESLADNFNGDCPHDKRGSSCTSRIPPFALDDTTTATAHMRRGRGKDAEGLVLEMFARGPAELHARTVDI